MQLLLQYLTAAKGLNTADKELLKSRWGDSDPVNIDLSGMDRPLSDASSADIVEYIFGDRLETPQRTRFILASTGVGSIVEAGWIGPRADADNGIDTLTTTKDFHVWCIDREDGDKIMDYPDHQLAPRCPFISDHVVRRAWSDELVEGIRPRFERESPHYIEHLINEKGSADNLLAAMEDDTFPLYHCLARAYFLHSRNPSRYEVVIGAFGFVQSDGRTFWESG